MTASSYPLQHPRALEPLIARSWQRSLETYKVDPERRGAPRVLSASALREHRAPMEPLLDLARSGLDRLFAQVRDAGYVVLMTDAEGVCVDFLSNPALAPELKRAGLHVGGCWSEAIEGTCAVGLCAHDQLAVTVHHGEHVRRLYSALTCSAAPVLAPDGGLLGVIDASALASPDDKRSQHLVLQMVRDTARMIENAHFLRQFEREWVLRVNARRDFLEVATEGLLALDGAGRVLAANPRLLHDIGLPGDELKGRVVDEVFDSGLEQLMAQPGQALALRVLHSGRRCFALARAPVRATDGGAARRAGAGTPAPEEAVSGAALRRLAGDDPSMGANVERALRVVDKGIALLLHGESGTGKEAFAKRLHEASRRRDAAFVALNCAAIPESLIESELFGYREGAFTGARAKGARGKVVQADGGTLFLDEIGDMPLAMQTRLLRVLAEQEVLPLGAEQAIAVDLQIICATHRDLTELVEAGRFRLDLYYRLNGLTLKLPALRERPDKEAVIRSVLREEAGSLGRTPPAIGPAALQALMDHPWPGNIRELKSVLRSALALGDGDSLCLTHLPLVPPPSPGLRPPLRLTSIGSQAHAGDALAPTGDAARDELVAALRRYRWNVTLAARELSLCRATVYRRMQRLGIVPPNLRG